MNRPESSKFVPGLPSDDDIDTQTNSASSNSVKIYDGVAECTMNDADTIKNVKIRAKDLAQEKLLNKIADYVDGFLRDRLLTFPDDEILAIVNEIYHITDVKYNTFDSDDNLTIRATVTAQIDDNDIINCLVRFFKERTELKSQNEALRNEIVDLKRRITNLTANDVIISLANQKYEEANKLSSKRDYEGAIKLYSEAIEFNMYDYKSCSSRGFAYFCLKQYEKAIQDYDKAIKINPINSHLYENRGDCYQALKQYEKAIQEYSKAIELRPTIDWHYQKRGECYQALGETAKAQADFKKARKLLGIR